MLSCFLLTNCILSFDILIHDKPRISTITMYIIYIMYIISTSTRNDENLYNSLNNKMTLTFDENCLSTDASCSSLILDKHFLLFGFQKISSRLINAKLMNCTRRKIMIVIFRRIYNYTILIVNKSFSNTQTYFHTAKNI